MSAARPRRRANAAAIRSSPVRWTAGTRSRAGLDGAIAVVCDDLGEVLVAAPGQADEVEGRVVVGGVVQRVVQRVGGLERRDDPLQPRDLLEGAQRVGVADGDVAGAAAVA